MRIRLHTSAAALLLSTALTAAAQPGAARDAEYAALRDKKLQSSFLKKAPWITDYRKALAESRASGKPVFAHFTRSYAR